MTLAVARQKPIRGFISAATGPQDLRAAAVALHAVGDKLADKIAADAARVMTPAWKEQVTNRIRDPREQIMDVGVRIIGGNPGSLVAADGNRQVGRALRTEHWPGFEYGANKNKEVTYSRRSKNGGRHKVTRRVQAGHPPRHRTGRVLGYATRLVLPRLASLWVQTVMRGIYDAIENGEVIR